MRISRIFLAQPLSKHFSHQTPVIISDDQAHYMQNVLRLNVGNQVTLFDGNGGEYLGVISEQAKKSITVQLEEFNPEDRVANRHVRLGLCIIKRDAMDTAIQKATELGVSEIHPLISDRVSVPQKQYQNRQQHWQNVAISACEQCGMNRTPKVHSPLTLETWSQLEANQKFCALPGGKTLQIQDSDQSINLLVGPEGGLSPTEIDKVQTNGFTGIGLGERILRAETAVITLTSLVMHLP